MEYSVFLFYQIGSLNDVKGDDSDDEGSDIGDEFGSDVDDSSIEDENSGDELPIEKAAKREKRKEEKERFAEYVLLL